MSKFDYVDFHKKYGDFDKKLREKVYDQYRERIEEFMLFDGLNDVVVDLAQDNPKKIQSYAEDCSNCVNACFLAINALLDLIKKNPSMTLAGDISIPYKILMICFEDSVKFFKDFSSPLELWPQHKLKAATEGFTYLNTVISALNTYDDEIKKAVGDSITPETTIEPKVINTAATTLNKAVEGANKAIKDSEINKQRGFKMLAAWFADFVWLFGKNVKKPDTKSYGNLFAVGNAVKKDPEIPVAVLLQKKERSKSEDNNGKCESSADFGLRRAMSQH